MYKSFDCWNSSKHGFPIVALLLLLSRLKFPSNMNSRAALVLVYIFWSFFKVGVTYPQFPPINLFPTQPPKILNCTCGVAGTGTTNTGGGDSNTNNTATTTTAATTTTTAPDNQQKIVNGTVAPQDKWEWQAALQIGGQTLCGGALINDRFVLTAAHCIVTTGIGLFPIGLEVVLNDYDLSTNDESSTIKRNVIRATPHPLYNAVTQDYDIALLELSSPVPLTSTEEPKVTPVCLPPKGDKRDFDGAIATVTGWGVTEENGDQPEKLMEVDVPVVSNELCAEHYADRSITERMLCAGYPEGSKDACQGDSGGPLVTEMEDGRWVEIGVVSWGEGCARPGKEGVYARVTELNDWIRSNAAGASWCQEE